MRLRHLANAAARMHPILGLAEGKFDRCFPIRLVNGLKCQVPYLQHVRYAASPANAVPVQ